MWLTNSCKRCNPKHQVQKCIKWNFSLVVSFESVSLKPLHMKSSTSFTAGVNPCGERRGWYQEARQTSRRLKVSCLILVCCHTEAFIPDYLQLPSSQLTSHKNTSWHNRQTDVPTRPSNAALTVSEDKQGFSSVLFPARVKASRFHTLFSAARVFPPGRKIWLRLRFFYCLLTDGDTLL